MVTTSPARRIEVRATVGCMLMGERGLYWKLTGRENLEYFGALYRLNREARRKQSQKVIDLLGLSELADRTVETYSSGQKMMLAFGKALVNDAPLLVLDEPTNTLDVPSASELRAVVRELNAAGKTVIYTTHIMSEAESLCDRVAIIDYGKLLALGPVEELKRSLKQEQIIRVEGVIPRRAAEAVQEMPAVTQATVRLQNGLTHLTVVSESSDQLLPQLIEKLTHFGARIFKDQSAGDDPGGCFYRAHRPDPDRRYFTDGAEGGVSMTAVPPAQTLGIHLSVVLASARLRLLNLSRYPGQLVLDIMIPIVFAAMPILLGRATSGPDIGIVFEANTGTTNYSAYMLIGSSVFSIVSYAFWHVAYWLRWEQETGTLEAIYLAPVHRIWVLAGTAMYSFIRSMFAAGVAFLLGMVILQVEPLEGEMAIALAFILVGLIPPLWHDFVVWCAGPPSQGSQRSDQLDAVGCHFPDGCIFSHRRLSPVS